METLKNKLLVLMLMIIVGCNLNAQSLLIKGDFYSMNEKTMLVEYTLKADTIPVAQGQGKKIKMKLSLNQNYSLTISKTGYQPKTVHFSTFAETEKSFRFDFLVLLTENKIEASVTTLNEHKAGHVFYDSKKQDFNYILY